MTRTFPTFVATLAILFCSCKKSSDEIVSNPLVTLHGKYEPIQVFADKKVDVNLDEVFSEELLTEIPNLNHAYLELRVQTKSGSNYLDLLWPNQSFSDNNGRTTPTKYDPSVSVMYVIQPTVFTFTANENLAEITVSEPMQVPNFDYSIPESVTLAGKDQIRVIFSKKLYTSEGMQTVKITALYRKYTSRM